MPVLSPDAMNSLWVHREINIAFNRTGFVMNPRMNDGASPCLYNFQKHLAHEKREDGRLFRTLAPPLFL